MRRLSRTAYGVIPRSYWDRRLRRLGQCLDGVGQIGLGQASNERDYEAKWERIQGVLDQLGVSPDWSVIDAGCGAGWFTERLVARGHVTHGVDFSKEAVSLARERVGKAASFEVSSLDRWSPHDLADLVLCIDVLFHIVDDRKWRNALEAIARAVNPNGLMLIQEHLIDERGEPASASHVHWRSRADYEAALPGWELALLERYVLPESGSHKDIMVWKRRHAR